MNKRSRRVIEKCGFRHEGTILRAFQRFDGQIFDDESYSILKEEYFNRKEKQRQRANGLHAVRRLNENGVINEPAAWENDRAAGSFVIPVADIAIFVEFTGDIIKRGKYHACVFGG